MIPRGGDNTESSKCRRPVGVPGGSLKVVELRKAKALKGDKSRSFQLINPENVGSRRFMITVLALRPSGISPPPWHGPRGAL